MNVRKFGRRLARDTRGANLVEYIMLVGLVAILCFAAFKTFGDNVNSKISGQAEVINGINSESK